MDTDQSRSTWSIPYPPGPGRVWRTDQDRHLLMNTVASQVTMFTDDTVTMAGPVRGGPSLAEWANFLSLMGPLEEYDDWVCQEARTVWTRLVLDPRLLRGVLRWVFGGCWEPGPGLGPGAGGPFTVAALGTDPDGTEQVVLADGTRIERLDAVVLAQGHLANAPTPREAALATFAHQHRLTYLPPVNPAEVDLSFIPPGEPVLLNGLGLCFFDYLARLSTGRGGTFERVDGRLVYRPSGREPRLYAGSRRGVPYHCRGENQKGPFGRHTPVLLPPRRSAGCAPPPPAASTSAATCGR